MDVSKKRPWRLGDTTVRTPLRIPRGSKALSDSNLTGRANAILREAMLRSLH
jgi:hypothetical protein